MPAGPQPSRLTATSSSRVLAITRNGGFMRKLLVLAAGLLLALLPASTAAGTESPGWTSPKKLGAYARDVDMATNQAGDMVMVWSTRTAVKARFRPAGGRWGSAERVARNGSLGDGVVTLTGAGRATVLWSNSAGLHVSDRGRDGTWRQDRTAPLVHVDEGGCGDEWVSGPVVMAADNVGNLFLTWAELGCDEGYSYFDHYVWRTSDGTWSRLYDGGGDGNHHDVVFPRRGKALMINTTSGIAVQTAKAGGELGPKRTVVPHGSYSGMDADLNPRGDLVVVARTHATPATGSSLVAVTRPYGGAWSMPHYTPVRTRAESPVVDLANSGRIVATYLRDGDRTAVVAQSGRVTGNEWRPPVVVAGGIRSSVHPPDVAVRDDGTAAVIWNRMNWPDTLSTHAAVQSAAGEWSDPMRLASRRTVDNHAYVVPDVVRSPRGFTAAFVRNGTLLAQYRLR